MIKKTIALSIKGALTDPILPRYPLSKLEIVGGGAFCSAVAAFGALPANTVNVMALARKQSPIRVFQDLRVQQFPFFKGAPFFASMVFVQQATKFYFNERYKGLLQCYVPSLSEPARVMIAGALAGISDAGVLIPTESILFFERMFLSRKSDQVPSFFFRLHQPRPTINPLTVARYLLNTHGLSSLTLGWSGLAWRNGAFTLFWLGGTAVYGQQTIYESDGLGARIAKQLPGVALGTLVGTPVSYPGHRMMVMAQTYLMTHGRPAPAFSGIQQLRTEFNQGGISAVYKGFAPYAVNFAIRFPVGLGLFIALRETVEHHRRR